MPRRARVTAPVVSVLAWVSGFALAGILPQAGGIGDATWTAWSRAAWAQRSGVEIEPSEWQRLAGPPPYRPAEPASGWLTENDLTRAVDLIADLGLFFAKLSETDSDSRARRIWARSQAAFGEAADDLRAKMTGGRFRIVVSEGSSLAVTRRGQESGQEIWVDSDLAGAWDVERVRRARWNGDDWSDVAILSGLLFDLWRAEGSAAGDAWMDRQRGALDLPEERDSGTGAAALITRYGFLKDLFLKASLLRVATAGAENAALWRDRAQRLQDRIETLLQSGPAADPDGRLAEGLRDDWAAYRAQIEQTSADRASLVLAARGSVPTVSRVGEVPPKPEPAPRAASPEDAGPDGPTPEAEEPAAQDSVRNGDPARNAAGEDLRARIAELEAARSRDQDYIALLLARAAEAARAAEEARTDLAAARSRLESPAEDQDNLQRPAEALAAELEQARSEHAVLQERVAEAQDRTAAARTVGDAAKAEVARLAEQLAAARSAARAATESVAEERDSLRREAEDLSVKLEQARSDQAALQERLAEARDRAATAEATAAAAETVGDAAKEEVVRLAAQLASARSTARSAAESVAEERNSLRREADALAAELEQALGDQAALQAQLAEARDTASAADQQAARLATQLEAAQTAARIGSESAAEAMAALQQQLAEAQNRAATAETAAAAAQTVGDAAKDEVARLAEQLAAARSATQAASESAAEENDSLRRQADALAAELEQARGDQAALQEQLAEARNQATTAEQQAARLAEQLAAARTAVQAASESAAEEVDSLRQQADALATDLEQAQSNQAALQQQLAETRDRATAAEQQANRLEAELAARDAEIARAGAAAADQAAVRGEAEAEIARLENQIEALRAAVADGEAAGAALATAESDRAALETSLADTRAALAKAQDQARDNGAALDQERARSADLDNALAESQLALTAARDQVAAEATRTSAAEAAAAQARERADDAERALTDSRDELARLREEAASGSDRPGESAAPRTGAATWFEAWFGPWSGAWRAPILVVFLLAVGLGVLLAVARRRAASRRPVPVASEAATSEELSAAPAMEHPVPVAAVPSPADARLPGEAPPSRPGAKPVASGAKPAAAITSSTIVEAVRRQDWATAEAQFAELSGISAPRLGELLEDPNGELLALACRAADLDRLTFATLYLLQGRGRAVADPDIVAEAVSLFETTGPAEAQRLLAERYNGDSQAAQGL